MNIQSNKYIFISGLHRSGTTLLHDIVGSNKNVSSFEKLGVPMNEGQFIQSVFPKPNRKDRRPGVFGFSDSSIFNELSDIYTTQNAMKLKEEWHERWGQRHEYYLEKSPPNILKTRFLQAVFPNSYFITIIRNPIAVSFATKKWSKTSINNLFKHWLLVHNLYSKDAQYLNRELTVSYEDLSMNSDKVLTQIQQFLSLNIEYDTKAISNQNEKYIQQWRDYKSLLNSKSKLILKYENHFNEYGYSLMV